MNENQIRDYLFNNYKYSIKNLIEEPKEPIDITGKKFPRICELLQHRTEQKIHKIIKDSDHLILDGKELRLVRDIDSTTRADLIGHFEDSGDLVIIELKKSRQTERQAFTELLAYANHFCTLFPPLTESSLYSFLVAPMEGRSVRDAFAQELIINNKNVAALVPETNEKTLYLNPYYPSEMYYQWIENSILDDRSMIVVTASFPLIDGWIDAGTPGSSSPPPYTQAAFETMTALISQKMENKGLHGFVYARQYWSELCHKFQNPNTIILCLTNPFSSFRTDSHEGVVYGESDETRLTAIQEILNQFDDGEYWLEYLHSAFTGQAIRLIQDSFQEFFINYSGVYVMPEISLPDWGTFKKQMVESVICHNMNIRITGLFKTVYTAYLEHCYNNGYDKIYFSDDLPKFGYIAYDNFLAVWEIMSGLSVTSDD